MRTHRTLVVFSAVIASLIGQSGATGQPSCGVHCGTERWAIKTLTDSAAATVIAAAPQVISVTDLVHRTAPKTLPANSRVAPTENQQFTVTALLIGWKEEGCGSQAVHFSPIRVEQVAKPEPDGEEAYAEARGGRS